MIGSYHPMVVFYHPEWGCKNIWYKEDNDVIGFQAIHLGAPDTATTFSIRVYATAAPVGQDRNIKAVAYGGDM